MSCLQDSSEDALSQIRRGGSSKLAQTNAPRWQGDATGDANVFPVSQSQCGETKRRLADRWERLLMKGRRHFEALQRRPGSGIETEVVTV